VRRLLFFLLLSTSLFATAKAVLFDYGHVLGIIDNKPIVAFISRSLKLSPSLVKKTLKDDQLYYALLQGEDYWASFAKKHGTTLPPHWMDDLNAQKKAVIHPVPGMETLISDLKARGYTLAILSNTIPNRSRFIASQGGYADFDPIILSWEVGVSKPDPKIYQIALDKLNLPATSCVFVDDKERNIRAAKKLGFDAIQFQSADKLRAALVKRQLL